MLTVCIKHNSRCHQPLILKQDADNVTLSPANPKPGPSSNTHNIERTTAGLLVLGERQTQLVNTHNLPEESKQFFTIKAKPSTQIDCVPMMSCQHRCTQTETHQCSHCTYQEHLILKRQYFIIQDAINSTRKVYAEPVTS